MAAASIAYTAVERMLTPQPLEEIGLSYWFQQSASILNFVTALILLRAGRQHNSITLEADAHHLLTDVWTSVGVIWCRTGLSDRLVWVDPIVALLVAANIVWTGYQLCRSAAGLMDVSLPRKNSKNRVTAGGIS